MVRADRAFSSSEPLLPETIKFIKENLEKYGAVHFELPHVFVVFGASGDLAKKKIFPTLWWLFRDGLLPRGFYFVKIIKICTIHQTLILWATHVPN